MLFSVTPSIWCLMKRGPKPRDLTGERYGMWTVLKLHSFSPRGVRIWLCRCDCGKEKPVSSTSLPSGTSKSCGCDRDKKTSQRSFRHGGAKRSGFTPEYKAWRDMMKRCFQENFKDFANYGGRGITVCEEWKVAANFMRDIPTKPQGKGWSLGRINNDGNYEPGNVRWETDPQQSRNKRNNRIISFQGDSLCLTDMAKKYSLSERSLRHRLDRGWDVEKALTTPINFRTT